MIRSRHCWLVALLTCTRWTAAAEPVAEPTPTIRQALVPPKPSQLPATSFAEALPRCASAYPTTDAGCSTTACQPYAMLNADQLEGLNQALQFLETTNHVEAATELRHKITELRLQYVSQQLEAQFPRSRR